MSNSTPSRGPASSATRRSDRLPGSVSHGRLRRSIPEGRTRSRSLASAVAGKRDPRSTFPGSSVGPIAVGSPRSPPASLLKAAFTRDRGSRRGSVQELPHDRYLFGSWGNYDHETWGHLRPRTPPPRTTLRPVARGASAVVTLAAVGPFRELDPATTVRGACEPPVGAGRRSGPGACVGATARTVSSTCWFRGAGSVERNSRRRPRGLASHVQWPDPGRVARAPSAPGRSTTSVGRLDRPSDPPDSRPRSCRRATARR